MSMILILIVVELKFHYVKLLIQPTLLRQSYIPRTFKKATHLSGIAANATYWDNVLRCHLRASLTATITAREFHRQVSGQDMGKKMGSPSQVFLHRVCKLCICRKFVPNDPKKFRSFLTCSFLLTWRP
jgi:hypothetical protein